MEFGWPAKPAHRSGRSFNERSARSPGGIVLSIGEGYHFNRRIDPMAIADVEIMSKSMMDRILAKNSPLAPDPRKRAPMAPAVQVPRDLLDASTDAVAQRIPIRNNDNDLTRQRDGRPLGERIILAGQVRTVTRASRRPPSRSALCIRVPQPRRFRQPSCK